MTAGRSEGRLRLTDGYYTIPKSRRHAARPILRAASLSVDVGECVGIVGPNGSGKSTLLKVLAGMLRLERGELSNDGARAGDWSRRYQRTVHLVAGVPLGFYPRLTASENLRFFAGLWGRDLTKAAALDLLSNVGLDADAATTAYAKFSLGMRQRLHIAAASLDQDATVWLLDEPTTGLDSAGVVLLERSLTQSEGTSKVIVSHDPEFLQRNCERILTLVDGALVA